VTYETIRQWYPKHSLRSWDRLCLKITSPITRQLKKKQGQLGDEWYLDEVFIKLNGKIHYLWRAVDQDGCGLDVFVSKSRNKKAALKFFRKLFRTQPRKPTVIITDKLPSYRAALRDIGIEIKHNTQQYANNIAEILKSRYYVWGGIVTNQPRLNYRKDGRLLNVTVRIDDKEEFMWTGH